MRKNSISYEVLNQLAAFGEGTLDALFPRKYARTVIVRSLLGLDNKKKIDKHTISTVLWRLKQQGLVERNGANKIAQWHITPAGREELGKHMPPASNDQKIDGITRLVIFDIPERERRKRNVIRAELVACQFQQLQKSVWMGNHPLSEDFINLIDTFGLSAHVHIFSVRDHGTINMIK